MNDKILDTYNTCAGMVVAVLAGILGPHWYLFAAYLAFQVADWGTGWYRSRLLHESSSKRGAIGIAKKTWYWVIIAISFLVAKVFIMLGKDFLNVNLEFLTLIGWFTLACLMVNEIRSIIENLVECGFKIPAILIKGLAVTEKLMTDKMDSTVPDLKINKKE